MLKPFERGADVFDFRCAAGVFAFAQAGAAKVKTQHRESEAVEGFHGVKNDFVMQRAAVERVRMAHDGGMSGVRGTGVQQSFKTTGRAVQE